MTPILRPSRAGDYEAMYDSPLPFTIQAETAELDGQIVGIGGIAYVEGKPVLFSRMKPELRPYKKFILKCAYRAAEMAIQARADAIASPDESLSCKLLQRIGLIWKGTAAEGEIYGWQRSQQL